MLNFMISLHSMAALVRCANKPRWVRAVTLQGDWGGSNKKPDKTAMLHRLLFDQQYIPVIFLYCIACFPDFTNATFENLSLVTHINDDFITIHFNPDPPILLFITSTLKSLAIRAI